MFKGFSDAAVDFLWGIRLNNDKSWFEAHKAEYTENVARPLRALAEQVHEAVTAAFPDKPLELHISRIYRDARRLHGRGPYKDHLWFTLRHGVRDEAASPAFYFEIGPEGYSYGMGFYRATPATMELYRRELDSDPEELLALIRPLAGQAVFILEGDEYARRKIGRCPELADWYNRKNLCLSCYCGVGGMLYRPELAETLTEGFRFLMPYYDYFLNLCRRAEQPLRESEW